MIRLKKWVLTIGFNTGLVNAKLKLIGVSKQKPKRKTSGNNLPRKGGRSITKNSSPREDFNVLSCSNHKS